MHQQFDSTPASAAPVRQIWDTSYVKRQDRFSYFREGVCQAYFALSPEKLNDRNIDARFERVEVFQGLISRISVTPHRLVRTKADVAKIPDEFVALRLQSNTPDGPVLLLNFNQIIDVPINFSQLNLLTLIIKRSALTKDVGNKDVNLRNSPLFNALSKCLQLLTRRYPFANLEELNYLVGAATSLLSAGFIKDKDYLQDSFTQHPSAKAGVLQLIKEFVKANLHDPSLSTAIVAAQFSVSPRYIQKISRRMA